MYALRFNVLEKNFARFKKSLMHTYNDVEKKVNVFITQEQIHRKLLKNEDTYQGIQDVCEIFYSRIYK